MTHRQGHVLLIGQNGLEREGLKHVLVDAGFSVRCIVPEHSRMDTRRKDRDGHHIILIDASVENATVRCRDFVADHPDAKIALLADARVPQQVIDAVKEGAIGVIDKNASCYTLINCLKLVTAGERVIPSDVIRTIIGRGLRRPGSDNKIDASILSEREKAVARGLANGLSNKIIARQLNLAEPTIKVHVKAILRKLGLSNRTQVAIWAVANESEPIGYEKAS
jgi:two-component system, NarL family, nitrate/nitrite response regulator NarL